jgi:hypothetical protein
MHARPGWRLRDTLTATALFLATAAFTLWQNSRVAVLWDLSYLLDSSYRIAHGQVPYRDFPFAHAPLTFLLHAAIIRVFGRIYFPHIACAAFEAGAATLLTWRILLKLTGEWPIALMLAAPLTVLGIYGIYPHPIYDSDAILAVLLALYLLQRVSTRPLANFITGAACVLPLFFKQNIGLFFLLATFAAVAATAMLRRRERLSIAPQLWLFAGATITLFASLLAIHATAGLHNYLYWTITFARQRRLPGLSVLLDIYLQTSLLWTIPAAVVALLLLHTSDPKRRHSERSAVESKGLRFIPRNSGISWPFNQRITKVAAPLLLAAPFLWTILSLAFDDPADTSASSDQLLSLWPHLLLLSAALALWNLRPANLRTSCTLTPFLPLILLATIHAAFLSQQLWGSTYAVWPLLTLLIAALLMQVPTIARPLAVTLSITFLLCGGLYATSHERLSYVQLDGPITRATFPSLHGLATPGPWIPAFEELIRVTNTEIPASDGILLLPGEAPFYFATGRTPHFPVLLFDPATDPYTPAQTRDLARSLNIRWLILTTNSQLAASPYDQLPSITAALLPDFTPYRTLPNYTLYRRR